MAQDLHEVSTTRQAAFSSRFVDLVHDLGRHHRANFLTAKKNSSGIPAEEYHHGSRRQVSDVKRYTCGSKVCPPAFGRETRGLFLPSFRHLTRRLRPQRSLIWNNRTTA